MPYYNVQRQLLKFITLTTFLVQLAACGGGGGGASATGGDPFAITCTMSGTEIHGCWMSSCELMTGGTRYGLYIVAFHTDGSYSTYFRLYDSATCTGVPFSQSNLVNDVYTLGMDVMTTNGTTGTEIDVDNASTTGYSIFDVTAMDTLCFPDPDYNWSPSGGGLGLTTFTELMRPDTLDYVTCLSRFTM